MWGHLHTAVRHGQGIIRQGVAGDLAVVRAGGGGQDVAGVDKVRAGGVATAMGPAGRQAAFIQQPQDFLFVIVCFSRILLLSLHSQDSNHPVFVPPSSFTSAFLFRPVCASPPPPRAHPTPPTPLIFFLKSLYLSTLSCCAAFLLQ